MSLRISQKATDWTKVGAEIIVGWGVGWTAKNVIENNVTIDEEKPRRTKAKATIGGAAIGSMAAQVARDNIRDRIDSAVRVWNKAVDKMEQKKTEQTQP